VSTNAMGPEMKRTMASHLAIICKSVGVYLSWLLNMTNTYNLFHLTIAKYCNPYNKTANLQVQNIFISILTHQ
jgi:hypothetical protein